MQAKKLLRGFRADRQGTSRVARQARKSMRRAFILPPIAGFTALVNAPLTPGLRLWRSSIGQGPARRASCSAEMPLAVISVSHSFTRDKPVTRRKKTSADNTKKVCAPHCPRRAYAPRRPYLPGLPRDRTRRGNGRDHFPQNVYSALSRLPCRRVGLSPAHSGRRETTATQK